MPWHHPLKLISVQFECRTHLLLCQRVMRKRHQKERLPRIVFSYFSLRFGLICGLVGRILALNSHDFAAHLSLATLSLAHQPSTVATARKRFAFRVLVANVLLRIELPGRRSPGHRSHQPEDRPIEPGTVVPPHNGPGYARVSIGVAPVQFVAII